MALPRISQPVWRAMLALGLSNQRLTCDDLYNRNMTGPDEFNTLIGHGWIKYRHTNHDLTTADGWPPKSEWPVWRVELTAPGQTAARTVVHYAAILTETRFMSRVVKTLLKYGTDSYGVARQHGKNGRKEIADGNMPGSLLVCLDDLTVLEQWGWLQAMAVPKTFRIEVQRRGDDVRDSDYQDMDLARALREDPDHARIRVVQSAASGRYTDCVNI